KTGDPAAPGGPAPVDPLALDAAPPLRGRVQSSEGAPIAGASIAAGQLASGVRGWVLATSDANGRFTLAARELPPSKLLEVGAQGWATRVVSVLPDEGVDPASGPREELVVILLPCRALTGRVVAAEDGRPL